jgi:hypothetical protein
LRDPSDHFARHPSADFFASTDCLSAEVEAAWAPQHNQPRCGHIPGNTWGRAYNSGIFAVRNNEAGRRMLRLWRDRMLGPQDMVQVGGRVEGLRRCGGGGLAAGVRSCFTAAQHSAGAA